MSPRRKSGLTKADLAALEHLPAVLTALEHLQEQHARVRALMGAGGPELARPPLRVPLETYTVPPPPPAPERTGYEVSPAERAEFEEAKKTGKPVPDVNPLANISPRRKSGLTKADLAALEHLPAVLTALEHLQEQHARVRALMGAGGPELARPPLRVPLETYTVPPPPPAPERTGYEVSPAERAEFEEAKKTGKPVPDVNPLANISEAQKERMAEQRALVQVMRAAKGLPPAAAAGFITKTKKIAALVATEEPEEAISVRTEELRVSEDGSVGATVKTGEHLEVLHAEES